MITLRAATADDAPLIVEFIRDLAVYEHLLEEVEATAERVRTTLFGPKSPAECVLAFVDGQPAGIAIYFINYSTFLAKPGLYLEDLFVRPDFRRRGVGRTLFLHLARLANERDYGRFEWSVLDWNEPAKKFYRSLGARQLDDWRIFRLTGEALRKLA